MIRPVFKSKAWLPSVFRDNSLDDLMDGFHKDFNRLFNSDRILDGESLSECRDENGLVVYALDVPGFNKDNLSVEVADGVLTISGESEVRKENSYGRSEIFKRLTVGDVVDAKAFIKDGILTVKLEYPSKEIKVKRVKISDGSEDCGCDSKEDCACSL